MSYDFNNASEQRSVQYGPVPAGSKVLLMLEIQPPFKQISQRYPMVGQTSNGFFCLNVKYTVIAGTYLGVFWFDSILLPADQQRIHLTEKQITACNIAATRTRSIIEAHRGISPKDMSPTARQKRGINDWNDLNEMQFPARLEINDKPREKDGKLYWKNRIAFIILPGEKEYETIMQGGEFINEGGAVTATTSSYNSNGNGQQSNYNNRYDDPFGSNEQIVERDFEQRQGDLEDVPF